jgi:ketosteroid isomerase-like protein
MLLTRLFIAGGVALLLGLLPVPRSWADAAAPDEMARGVEAIAGEIAMLHGEFWSAFERRDLFAVGELWDRDNGSISAIFPASATPAIGWGSVSESFRRAFSHNRDIRISTKVVRIFRNENLVWLIAAVHFSATQTQTGQPVMIDRELATEIFSRRDGRWRMVHYHGHNPAFIVPPLPPENLTVNAVVPKRQPSEIWTAYGRFRSALQNRSLAGMFQVFDPDGEVAAIQPRSPVPFLKLENVLASWKRTFAEVESITCDPQVLELNEAGGSAWLTDLSQYHIVFKDNPNEVVHFHNVLTTMIFTKRNGEWYLSHYHAHLGFSFDEHND